MLQSPKPTAGCASVPEARSSWCSGKTPNSSKRAPPPAPIGIRRQQTKPKTPSSTPKTRGSAVRASQPSLREHRLEFQRKKQAEVSSANGKPKASPLDDPIILVQQLPDFKTPPSPPVEPVAELPPPAPTTVSSSSDLAQDETEQDDHELTALPAMANLEFERMVLQLKSAVESDMTTSDDENDDEDEQSGDPDAPPPPYSTIPAPLSSMETLSISVLEDPAFRLALQKRLQLQSNAAEVESADEVVVDPGQEAALNWMHTYVVSLL